MAFGMMQGSACMIIKRGFVVCGIPNLEGVGGELIQNIKCYLAFTKGIYSRDRLKRYCSNIMGEDAGCHAGDEKQAEWASQANPRVI